MAKPLSLPEDLKPLIASLLKDWSEGANNADALHDALMEAGCPHLAWHVKEPFCLENRRACVCCWGWLEIDPVTLQNLEDEVRKNKEAEEASKTAKAADGK